MSLKENINLILNNIKSASLRVGRDPSTVRLMLVSKTVEVGRIQETIDLGYTLFGENKVQELKEKVLHFSNKSLNWHLIGHLQSNKVKDALDCAVMIHSVDRMKLANKLERELELRNKTMDILVQVNTSMEESKFGLHPDEVISFIKEVSKLRHLKIKGLMTLALFSNDENKVRPCFKKLKSLFDQIKEEKIEHVEMKELSMGMSGDYEWAIEEGATIVRVGTAIFGKRKYPDSYYWPN